MLHPTRNDQEENLRRRIIELLNKSLCSAIHMGLQAKQVHWNVKGPTFFSLHMLFDQVYEASSSWADLLGERAVQLGGVAEGTLERVHQVSQLPRMGLDLAEGPACVSALTNSLAVFCAQTRAAITTATQEGDAGTADLLTEVSRGADKMLWFLEAHLQAAR